MIELKEWGSKVTADEIAQGLDAIAKTEKTGRWPLVSNLLKYKSTADRIASLERDDEPSSP